VLVVVQGGVHDVMMHCAEAPPPAAAVTRLQKGLPQRCLSKTGARKGITQHGNVRFGCVLLLWVLDDCTVKERLWAVHEMETSKGFDMYIDLSTLVWACACA